jgi:integrase
MPRLVNRLPLPRLHKPSGQVRLRIDGRDYYFGKPGPDAHAAYERLVAVWLANGRTVPPGYDPRATGSPPTSSVLTAAPPSVMPVPAGGILVAELVARYAKHCLAYYRRPDGSETSEPRNIRFAIDPLKKQFGSVEAALIGPRELKAVREKMVEAELARKEVNKRIARVVRMFKWAAGEGLLSPTVYQSLKCVEGLKKGRTTAREAPKVKPVDPAHVDAVKPHLSRQVWAMIELGRLTGMRVGEVTIMRTCDLDRSGDVWVYRPSYHKMQHLDDNEGGRVVYLGAKAQSVLIPWLLPDRLERYLFRPVDSMREFSKARRRDRKSAMTPSQKARK